MVGIAWPDLEQRSEMRPPISQAFGADLGADRIRIGRNGIVCAAQVDGARNRLQVAALNNIKNEFRMLASQTVPKLQQTFSVSYLRDPLAVGRIILLPEWSESEVTILSVNVNAFLVDKFRDRIDHELSGRRIAKVKHPKLHHWSLSIPFKVGCDFSDKPIWMLDRERGPDDRPFRFKPQQEFHALSVSGIADWL